MKKKSSNLIWLACLPFVIWFGLLCGSCCGKNINILIFMQRLNALITHPFQITRNEYTVKAVLIVTLIYFCIWLYFKLSPKNYRFREEYGSAKWVTAKQFSQRFGDKRPENNRILTKDARISLNTWKTKRNNNVLVIGGSGAGKTRFFAKPNIMQCNDQSSFITTDPKGEILRSVGWLLKERGYKIRVLNLIEMTKSNRYNPFRYIREDKDVMKLITNLITNTTPKGAKSNDPFWEKAEALLLQALMYYVWYEGAPEEKNFVTILELLSYAKVKEEDEDYKSPLDLLFYELEKENPRHPAVLTYNKFRIAAGQTLKSIIISINARLSFLENDRIKDVLCDDEFDISHIGTEKTAIFCVISDTDKTFNPIVGMLYTQIFQELYYQADFVHSGSLPMHVTCLMDEFANVALPEDFCTLLSTMRSRNISAIIIIQALAQAKALFKDTWEVLVGNCDTFLFLGGNDQGTLEFVSKRLGKETIDKRSFGRSKGKSGSFSTNEDVLGRDLLTPSEVGLLDDTQAIVKERGYQPVMDIKYDLKKHNHFAKTADGGAKPYDHVIVRIMPLEKIEDLNVATLAIYNQEEQEYERLLSTI